MSSLYCVISSSVLLNSLTSWGDSPASVEQGVLSAIASDNVTNLILIRFMNVL